MSAFNYLAILVIGLWGVLSADWAYAGPRSKGLKRALPGGIVFPAMGDSVRVNPSYLPDEKARIFQAHYNPPSSEVPDAHEAQLSLASSDRGFGWGIDYRGTFAQGLEPNYALSIGAGVRADIFSFGLGLNAEDLEDGFKPDISLGLRGKDGKMFYQAVFNKLNENSQLDLGAGISDDKSYSLELNVSLPPFNEITQGESLNNYKITAALSVYDSYFGASAITSFNTATHEHTHRFSVLIHPTSFLYICSEVAVPLRYGLTLTFSF